MARLEGKVAVVLGAAAKDNMGQDIARPLAREGARLVVCGRHADTLTAVAMPEGVDADAVRATILENFDLSLGQGLGKVAGKLFRIGHLGDFNDLMLMGTLAGVEMGLDLAKVPHQKGGAQAAMDHLARTAGAG